MEETEVEEEEALSNHGEDGGSTIDPDIALSYIEERLQNVLGHFRKDFESGVSAEYLGAKFGGYGSFLPTYQHFPSWSHTRGPQELRNCDSTRSPGKSHTKNPQELRNCETTRSPGMSHTKSPQELRNCETTRSPGKSHTKSPRELRNCDSTRFPGKSHTRSPQELRNCDSTRSPGKLDLEDRKQNSLASSDPSPSFRPCAASGKGLSMENSFKGNVCLQSRHAKESSPKCGVVTKSVNPSDQRTLKFQIKVGSENLSTQENGEIYSGRGLVVYPSSSLEDSLPTSEGLHGKLLDVDQSPTSILEIMTSFPEGILLSPLSEDLINLSEPRKLGVKSEPKLKDNECKESSRILVNGFHSGTSNQKVLELKKLKSSEKDVGFSIELTNQKNFVDLENTGSLSKSDKETDIDDLGCEELVSISLKPPLLLSSEYTVADPTKSKFGSTTVPVEASAVGVTEETSRIIENASLGGKYTQDIGRVKKLGEWTGSSSKASESKKGNCVSSMHAYSQQDVIKEAFELAGSIVPKGRKTLSTEPVNPMKHFVFQKEGSGSEEGSSPALENSSTGGKKKSKGVRKIGSQPAYMSKGQLIADSSGTSKKGNSTHNNGLLSEKNSCYLQQGHEKPGNRYKDSFGDREFAEDDNESLSGETTTSVGLKDSQLVRKRILCESKSLSKHKCNIKNSEKPWIPEKYPRVASHVVPSLENGQCSEDPNGMVPLVDEFWVLCEKCKKWRLLPLYIEPKSLPEKWLCRMLTWVPGMNHCRIPEEVTNNAVKALNHPAASVRAPSTESQHNWLNNSVPTSEGVASFDSKVPGQVHGNMAFRTGTISGKKKHEAANASNTTDIDGSTHSSDSRRKNLPLSGKGGNFDNGNPSLFLDASGYQHTQQSNDDIEKHNEDIQDKRVSIVNCSDKGTSFKIRSMRESEFDGSRASKKFKGDGFRDDENWTSDNVEASLKTGIASTSTLSSSSSENDQQKYTNHKDARIGAKKNTVSVLKSEMHVPCISGDGLGRSDKSDCKKRKDKEHRSSQIHTEPLSSSERRHQDSGESMEEMRENNPQKSKKAKVSKFGGKDIMGSKNSVGTDRKGSSNQCASEKHFSDQCNVEVKTNSDQSQKSGSHSKKSVKGLSPHSQERDCTPRSDLQKVKKKASVPLHDSWNHMHIYEEKAKSKSSKLDEEFDTPGEAHKLIVKKDTAQGTSREKSKPQTQNGAGGHDVLEVTESQDKKQTLQEELVDKKLQMKSDQVEVCASGKSHSLSTLARVLTETVNTLKPDSASKKQNGVEAPDSGSLQKAPNHSKKAENQNGQPVRLRHPTPNRHKARDVETPTPLRRDSSAYSANMALKEAKDLKHLADRHMNSGSTESNGYYFQAVLKFLHGASLLENRNNAGTMHNDIMHAMHIYSSSAKLCKFCALNYEKSKDMAAAALAYKCMEVAYMRVVFSSHISASRDRNELQTALEIIPPGESLSSSASDVDNLYQPAADKVAFTKVVGSPQVSGSQIVTSQNCATFSRLLKFTEDVNFAMEASRKSGIALAAATSMIRETLHKEGISSLKKALDFNFQDVERFLRLVRVAMEAISH